jgi:hypothetical protein
MNIVARIAEQRIEEAVERGDFDELPGAGRPLDLHDDALVPPELRAAYRLLRNSGFIPLELELRREIRAAHQLLDAALTASERSDAARRLEVLKLRLESCRGRPLSAEVEESYYRQLLGKMEGDPPPD